MASGCWQCEAGRASTGTRDPPPRRRCSEPDAPAWRLPRDRSVGLQLSDADGRESAWLVLAVEPLRTLRNSAGFIVVARLNHGIFNALRIHEAHQFWLRVCVGGSVGSCFLCSSGPSVASELSFDVLAGPAHQALSVRSACVRTRFPVCNILQSITKLYSYNRASLINIETRSGAGDTSGLPRQPIHPTGELAGRRGDELVISINDRS